MSLTVAVIPASLSRVMYPSSSKSKSALASFVVSLGTAIVTFSTFELSDDDEELSLFDDESDLSDKIVQIDRVFHLL